MISHEIMMIDSFFRVRLRLCLFSIAILKGQTPAVKTAPVSKGTLTSAEEQVFCTLGPFRESSTAEDAKAWLVEAVPALCGSVVVLEEQLSWRLALY